MAVSLYAYGTLKYTMSQKIQFKIQCPNLISAYWIFLPFRKKKNRKHIKGSLSKAIHPNCILPFNLSGRNSETYWFELQILHTKLYTLWPLGVTVKGNFSHISGNVRDKKFLVHTCQKAWKLLNDISYKGDHQNHTRLINVIKASVRTIFE